MANSLPFLSDLSLSVTLDEEAVNLAPQLIDADVTFFDADNNFDGGTLVLSGALSEDTLAIRNQGTGVGEIGLSGSDVTYEGTVIGTFAGGSGGVALSVTFNAQATSVSIEALIENLTYQNLSDTPVFARALELTITDADGAHAVGPTVMQAVTGAANPFNGVDAGYRSTPSFADLDGDGDLDAVVGEEFGTLRYYENTGDGVAPAYVGRTGAANPFDGINVVKYSMPILADLDGDGDLDAVIGDHYGKLNYYENIGDVVTPVYVAGTGADNPFNGLDVGFRSTPAFGDLDGDGDLDAVVGESFGTLKYFENTGTGVAPAYVERFGAANPFNGVDVGFLSKPAFADLNSDGDLDAVIGEQDGVFNYYENTGTGVATEYVERTGVANPFNGIDIGWDSAPAFADLDGDGDLDAVSGELYGTLQYFENTDTGTVVPVYVEQTGAANPFNGIDVGDQSAPSFADLDSDGDLDAVVGEFNGTLKYFENTSTGVAPAYVERTGAANPFNGIDVSLRIAPSFADLDGDGDLDAVIGEHIGNFHYYENTGTGVAPAYVEQTGAANPFNGIEVGSFVSTPALADLDGDGDLDAVSGEKFGTLKYFENTGTAVAPAYVEQTGAANPFNGIPFNGIDFTNNSAPSFADLDGDGDLDAVSGEYFGRLRYFENTGTGVAPAYVARTGAANPFNGIDVGHGSKPSFADLDGDGDFDVVIGAYDGTLKYYENTGPGGFQFVLMVTQHTDPSADPDVMNGTDGNDTLDGLAGSDTLIGGGGNDTYRVDSQTDVIIENDGEGTDAVISTAGYYVLAANVENLTHDAGGNHWSVGNTLANVLTGNDQFDTLEGGSGADSISGGGADDQLFGGADNDTLDGGGGVDTLVGGADDDLYVLNTYLDVVIEDPSGGTDTLLVEDSYTLPDYFEHLTLTGTGNFSGTGNALANHIIGNSGNNTLNGLGGVDTLAGGAGNDNYFVDVVADVIIEADGEGTDSAYVLGSTYVLGDYVENLYLWSNLPFQQATGNALDNYIVGGDYVDTLDGGVGADTMDGYTGDDTYYVDDPGDVIFDSSGFDTVISTISYTLTTATNYLRLAGTQNIDGTGNGFDNQLFGNSGDNVLDSGGGSGDWLQGGSGNDTYIVRTWDVTVIEDVDAGDDIVYASATFSLPDNVEDLVLTEAGISSDGTGNALGNAISGNSYVNHLDGGAGEDTLDGGAGEDFLTGGTGSDVFVAAGAKDYFTDFTTGAGGDQIDLGVLLAGATNYAGGDPFASGHIRLAYAVSDLQGIWIQYDLDGGGDAYLTAANVQGSLLITDLTADNFVGGFDPALSPNQAPTVYTAIEGTATEGDWVEMVSHGFYDPDGAGTESLQWQSSADGIVWSDLAGWTSSAFLPDDADVGRQIRLVTSYTDGRGTLETLYSNATSAVVNVNDAPVAGDDTVSATENTPLVFAAADLVANDTDVENDALTVTAVGNAVNGTVSLVGGNITFTPDADFTGTASFNYTVSDGTDTDSGAVTVNVAAAGNNPPVANDDTLSATEDTPLTFAAADLVGNDADADDDTLTVTAVGNPVNGTVSLVGGQITFTPDANYYSTASFDYTLSDGTDTDTGHVAVNVAAVNDVPVAGDDTISATEDTPLTFAASTLVGNDSDAENDALTVTAVGNAVSGTVSLVGGNITFTPNADFFGTASFDYTVSDGTDTDTGAVTVNVAAVNDAPVANDEVVFATEDTPVTLAAADLVGNDTDADDDTLTVTAVGNPVNGTVSLVGGQITFTPDANYYSTASFDYTLSDGTDTDTGHVAVNVAAVNDVPVAGDDTISATEDTPLTFAASTLVGNDSDAENDALTVTAVGNAVNGTVGLVAGQITFTPDANFNGTASFDYTVSDGNDTDSGAVTVNVAAVNDAPVALDDTLAATEDTPINYTAGAIKGNDSDDDDDTLVIDSVTSGAGGTVVLELDGTVTFTPTLNFNGPAGFTYVVSDGNGGTDSAAVTVNVAAVNDAPTVANAIADQPSAQINNAFTFTFAANTFNDVEGDSLTYTATLADNSALPSWLTFTAGTRTFSGTPLVGDIATIDVKVTANDGNGGTSSEVFLIPIVTDNETLTGGAGDDVLSGGTGNDSLSGGLGNDNLQGNSGVDTLIGNAGNDTLDGGAEADLIYGSADHDSMLGGAGIDTLVGNAGNDTINGGTEDDQVFGSVGDDYVLGGLGADVVQGNAGNDTVVGGDGTGTDTLDGNDSLDGGAGNDSLSGGFGADNVLGGAGFDTLIGNAGNDTMDGGADGDLAYGSAGDDSILGGAGIDTLVGNAGNDTLNGGTEDDQVFGSVGDDYVLGGLGADVVQGNAGNDTVIGGDGTGTDTLDGNDSLDGGAGNDSLSGGFGNDNVLAGAGFDTVIGNAGNDTLDGGADGDLAYGSAGDDSVLGGAGADTLVGNAGNDVLNGGTENDQIFGSTGNDVLIGGAGNDTMQGNAGTDTFRYDALSLNTGDVAAGQADFVSASAAGDLISMLGLNDELTIGNIALSALTTNTLVGNALNATNNVAFTGGALQIDLDGNDTFNALNDFQVQLTGVTSVTYNATSDLFQLS